MRVSWFSNSPLSSTGYGTQTKLFVPRIKALGHEVAITAFYGLEGGVIEWNGVPIFPKHLHPYGMDVMAPHAKHWGADIIISLMDAWVIPQGANGDIPLCPLFPIDHDPLPPPIKRVVEKVFCPIVFSHFGERMMAQAEIPCLYVPHAVDTSIFAPMDQAEARRQMGMPEDIFLVGMVAANQGAPSRKAFHQQIEAFAKLYAKHPDARLYLHTQMCEGGERGGVNIPEFLRYLGIAEQALITDQYALIAGLPEEWLARLYSCFDLLTNVSFGEGFGVTILEAQAAGTPVLVGDWTSMSELCFGGWLVPQEAGSDRFFTPLGGNQHVPRVEAIYEQMEAAYLAGGRRDAAISAAARTGALAYDADHVTATYWRPALEAIAGRLGERPISFEQHAAQAARKGGAA